MLNNGNKACEYKDEIVSYIYDEIDTTGRRKFESHLAACMSCTDEFAAISDARFSVFEYQREEFAPLVTPEIVIPYPPKRSYTSTASSGFWTGFAELFSFARSPLAIGGALAILLGVGFIAFNMVGVESDLVAGNSKVPPVDLPTKQTAPVVMNDEKVAMPPEREIATSKIDNQSEDVGAVKAVVAEQRKRKPRSTENRRLANDVAIQSPNSQSAKPMLSNFKEEEDRTLRLSDMFDDLGG